MEQSHKADSTKSVSGTITWSR